MPDRIPREQITGLLLAGGLGKRMGHLDKGLQPLNGSTLAGVTLQRLQTQVGHRLINANRNLNLYEQFGCPVVQDHIAGHAGPLAGMHAGLQHCKTPYLLSVPCDTPGFPEDLVQRLGFAMQLAAADLAFAVTGESSQPDLHPVFCLMKTSLLPSLDTYLRAGGRKVAGWMMQQPYAQAHFSDEKAFMNINTPEDLQTFSSRSRPPA